MYHVKDASGSPNICRKICISRRLKSQGSGLRQRVRYISYQMHRVKAFSKTLSGSPEIYRKICISRKIEWSNGYQHCVCTVHNFMSLGHKSIGRSHGTCF